MLLYPEQQIHYITTVLLCISSLWISNVFKIKYIHTETESLTTLDFSYCLIILFRQLVQFRIGQFANVQYLIEERRTNLK